MNVNLSNVLWIYREGHLLTKSIKIKLNMNVSNVFWIHREGHLIFPCFEKKFTLIFFFMSLAKNIFLYYTTDSGDLF